MSTADSQVGRTNKRETDRERHRQRQREKKRGQASTSTARRQKDRLKYQRAHKEKEDRHTIRKQEISKDKHQEDAAKERRRRQGGKPEVIPILAGTWSSEQSDVNFRFRLIRFRWGHETLAAASLPPIPPKNPSSYVLLGMGSPRDDTYHLIIIIQFRWIKIPPQKLCQNQDPAHPRIPAPRSQIPQSRNPPEPFR